MELRTTLFDPTLLPPNHPNRIGWACVSAGYTCACTFVAVHFSNRALLEISLFVQGPSLCPWALLNLHDHFKWLCAMVSRFNTWVSRTQTSTFSGNIILSIIRQIMLQSKSCNFRSVTILANKSNRSQPKFTITKIILELMFLEVLQYQSQTTHIFILTLGIYKDIMNEYNYKKIKIISEHPIHKVHKTFGA